MELYLAGGVGEHGRNCFLVEGQEFSFLVDCGKMADTPADPYPRLYKEQIRRLDAVLLTHSHGDHTGALPWLHSMGFKGKIIAAEETLVQLPFPVEQAITLESLCPQGIGTYGNVCIRWGRSGHCAGSVWYHFTEGEKSVLFSGDYTEDSLIYACDPIRGQQADVAVLDCAYGNDETDFDTACHAVLTATQSMLDDAGFVLFPVPKFGRGLELLKLLSDAMPNISYYGDDVFLAQATKQRQGGYWYKQTTIAVKPALYTGQKRGVLFISDPQLRTPDVRQIAEQVRTFGGQAIMTGTVERNSYSEACIRQGWMKQVRYPVHLCFSQYQQLKAVNQFQGSIPYHTPVFASPAWIHF